MTDSTSSFATPYRSHTCGALRASDAGATARLAGWVHRRRDHGQLIFLDLRDRYGLTQVVVDATESPEAHAAASRLRTEFVVSVSGTVAARLPGSENARLATGAIELRATAVDLLAEAKTPPFYINEPDAPIDEALRLRYRYLDIRREPMQERLLLRSRLVQSIREFHHAHGFVEIETPNLIKSTPEGARDFIVPSRLRPGSVYALPQSPQQLKQLLMVGGLDRYFQVARCFRDEDARGDRQPEFTQLDLEMSFVDEAMVIDFVEDLAIRVTAAVVPDRPLLQVPFPRFTFAEAIERFGSDKPDLRFGMELVDLAPALAASSEATEPGEASGSGFRVFDEALASGGRVKAIVAPGMAGASRSQIDELTELARGWGAKGLVWLAVEAGGSVRSSIAKFLGPERVAAVVARAGAQPGDLILVIADEATRTADVLGRLRTELGGRLGLAEPNVFAYCWVTEFPMYKWDPDNRRWDATHNPFSGVRPD
ncbi:MAG TPA: aspartate--tRNA ligase, partial [Candidatus Limnocylindrales bacterium]